MQNPPRLDRLAEPIRVADSPISGKCSLHFPDIGGANPEELLWQQPEQRFRPSRRIFHEKCGLDFARIAKSDRSSVSGGLAATDSRFSSLSEDVVSTKKLF
jgi:hypothetical protein